MDPETKLAVRKDCRIALESMDLDPTRSQNVFECHGLRKVRTPGNLSPSVLVILIVAAVVVFCGGLLAIVHNLRPSWF